MKDGSFATWTGLTEKLVLKYLPEAEITAKGHPNQQKQQPAAEEAANITHLSTKEGYNTGEALLQLFEPTRIKCSDLTGNFPVKSDRANNYILVA